MAHPIRIAGEIEVSGHGHCDLVFACCVGSIHIEFGDMEHEPGLANCMIPGDGSADTAKAEKSCMHGSRVDRVHFEWNVLGARKLKYVVTGCAIVEPRRRRFGLGFWR